MKRLHFLPFILVYLCCDVREHNLIDVEEKEQKYNTIRSLQDLNDKAHPKLGEYIWLKGVVVTAIDQFDEDSSNHIGSVWVQDPNLINEPYYSGILIYKPQIFPLNIKLKVGDIVEVYGEYEEFCYNIEQRKPDPYCPRPTTETLTEIGYASLFKIGETIPIQPYIIQNLAELNNPSSAERWEGVLIKVNPIGGLTVTSIYNRYGEATLKDRDGNELIITDELYHIPDLEQGRRFRSITGVFTWFFKYKLSPRFEEDIEYE